jgi:hypothetical protein
MKNVLFFSILFCTITLPVFGQLTQTDLDKIRLIINDEIKKEISNSEKRMKEYISQEIKTVNVKISEIDKRLNMLFGVVIALIAVIAIPQIIVAWRSSKYNELERKIEHLTQEIQTLKQQRIVSS